VLSGGSFAQLPSLLPTLNQNGCHMYLAIVTTEGGGLAVKSVVSSGLGCGGPRFESRNGKRLGLNPTIPTLDPLVLSWGWDSHSGRPLLPIFFIKKNIYTWPLLILEKHVLMI
jgi:hypothetical protein